MQGRAGVRASEPASQWAIQQARLQRDPGSSRAPRTVRGRSHTAWAAPVADHTCVCAGVCLYVMAAGALPFEEASLASQFRRISRAEYTCPPWLSPDLVHLLARLLEPDARKRCARGCDRHTTRAATEHPAR